MPRWQREALVPYSAQQMFEMVNDVSRYPEFVPALKSAHIMQRDSNSMRARLQIAKAGFQQGFVTQNQWTDNERISMQLVEGPFRQLAGHWQFQTIGNACKVSIVVDVEFSSMLSAMAMNAVLPKAIAAVMDAFLKRAQQLHAIPSQAGA